MHDDEQQPATVVGWSPRGKPRISDNRVFKIREKNMRLPTITSGISALHCVGFRVRRIGTRRAMIAASCAVAIGLPAALAGTTNSSWLSSTTGNWSNAADWNPATVPNNNSPTSGDLYNVTIGSGTVTLDIDPTIQQLNLSGGIFTGSGTTLTLDDLLTWTGGTLGASGSTEILNATAGMSIVANAELSFPGGTINNTGVATWTGTGGYIYAFVNALERTPRSTMNRATTSTFKAMKSITATDRSRRCPMSSTMPGPSPSR